MARSFQEVIASPTPTLVDFYADWCGPCKQQAPILDELKRKMGDAVTIVKIDVDRNGEAAQQLGIQSIPTLMLFKEGKALWRHSGVVGASVLEEIIHKGGVTV